MRNLVSEIIVKISITIGWLSEIVHCSLNCSAIYEVRINQNIIRPISFYTNLKGG